MVESICTRLGITTRVMPSMESFGSANSRKAATKLAMEGVGDAISRVWQAVKEAIINLWNKIVAFVKKILNGNLALEKAAKALKERVAKLKGIPEEDKFEDSSICNAFGVEKVNAASVISVLNTHMTFCTNSTGIEGAIKAVVDAVASNAPVNAGISSSLRDFIGKGITNDATEKETTLYEDKSLINGECIKVTAMFKEPTFDKDNSEEGEVTFAYSFVKSEKASTTGKDVTILSKNDMTKICTEVETLAKDNNKLVSNIEKGRKQVDLFGKAIDKLMGEEEDKVGEDEGKREAFRNDRKLVNFKRKAISLYATKVGTFATAISGKNIKAGKAALNYVSKCSNKYKSE